MRFRLRLLSLLSALALLAWVCVTIPAHPIAVQAQGAVVQPGSVGAQVVSLFWHPAVEGAEALGTQPIEAAQLGLAADAVRDAKQISLAFLDRLPLPLRAAGDGVDWDPFRTMGQDAESHVRLRQVYQGVPVFAGEVVVHLKDGAVVAANGEYLAAIELSVKPELSAQAAFKSAKEEIGLAKPLLAGEQLVIYSPALLGIRTSSTHLAYHLTIDSAETPDVYVVFVDAHSGKVLWFYNDLQEAKDRRIYELNGSTYLPGSLCYTEAGPQGSVSADCQSAFQFTGDTYDYYAGTHGRDSFDDHGAAMIASVRYGSEANAFWDGYQTAYGPGFAVQDVVAHEWTHAVTQHTADLIYAYESGALNEGVSDIFGAMIDRGDWLMGEDTPIGAIRSLSDPTVFGDPGRVGDSQFYCGFGDNGGVHTNNGVPNHTAYLMADGGTYNGRTITGIGRDQTERIWYRALTVYFTRGTSFSEARNALNSACADLYGSGSSTCASVDQATLATEMDQPVCGVEPAEPDDYEEDDSYQRANEIAADGTLQTHNFHDTGDNDWVWFSARSGCDYSIETSNLGSRSDTYVYLYAPDGQTQIESNDDGGDGLASRIDWTAPAAGTYYVRIRNYDSSVQGAGTNYDLGVTQMGCGVEGDEYEPDNSYTTARPIEVNGAAQRHNLHVAGDDDWVYLDATAQSSYVVETSDLASRCDTEIYLFDSEGVLVRSDDDGGTGRGSRIAWTPLEDERFFVQVRHRSSEIYGEDTEYSLRVTGEGPRADRYEVDNSPAEATTISEGSTQADHTFHEPGDNDWAKFSATANCSYVIDTLNLAHRSDTYMYLYGTDGATLLAYSDDDGEGLASRIAWTAPGDGDYYIRVRHYSASAYGGHTDYDLRVQNAGCDPEGDEYEDDDETSRASTIPATGAPQAHTFHDAGDQDWVRFSAQPGVIYTLETYGLERSCDTYMYLYGEDGQTLLAQDDDGGEGLASRIVWSSDTGGTYLVRVRHYQASTFGPQTGYLFSVTEGGGGTADRYEDDDAAARATAIEGLQAEHNLHDVRDQDWVQFSATEGTSYVIETLNLETRCDTYLDLYDADGSTRLLSDDDGGAGLASRIEWTAPASSTFYVRVRHYNGDVYGAQTGYDLRVGAGDDGADGYEPDDSAGSANSIQVNAEAQAHNFHDAGDHDWVWFQASADGAYTIETLNLGSWSDTVMVLYRPDGQTEIATNDDDGEGLGSRITWTADTSGWYLVMVRQFGDETHGPHTRYDLRIVGPSVSADAYEPDNSAAQAQAIVVGGDAQTHNFHVAGDEDWVRFDAEAGEVHDIWTSNLCSQSDTYLYLYDRDGRTPITANDDGGEGLGSRIEWTAHASGTYFVRVRHYSAPRYGEETCYDLAVETRWGAGGDDFEPDDVYAQASDLHVNGASQRHNFHMAGDYDWVRFETTQGCAYVLDTFDLGYRSDTYLYLYDQDGGTLITANDDGGPGLSSRIEWTAPFAGTYYSAVRHYSGYAYGDETDYSLRVTTDSCAAAGEGDAPGDTGVTPSPPAQAGTIVSVELPVAVAREGEEVEAVVYVHGETAAVKVQVLVKPEYLAQVQVVPLSVDGSPVDESTPDAVTRYPDRWQVVSGEDGLTSVWYAGKGEWDGAAAYPVVRIRWRVVAPLPGEMAIPFVVTLVDQGGRVETERVHAIVQPPEDDPPTNEFRIYLPLTTK